MSSTVLIPNKLYDNFIFFESGGANGAISTSIAPGKIFKLDHINIHTSVAFASTEDFVVRVSAATGSAYNAILFSYAMSGSQYVQLVMSQALMLLSDDQIVITLSLASGANTVGIFAQGWSVSGR